MKETATTQSPAEGLPGTDSGFSSGHGEHSASPSESLYVAVGHATQIPPLAASPQKPGAQPQLLATLLPSADAVFAPQLVQVLELVALSYVPDGHATHAALPVAILLVPAPHRVQGPPSLPVFPTEHIHAVTATLPVTDRIDPDGHVEQSVEPVAPSYLPSGHEEHGAVPVPLLYVPALHAVQPHPLAESPAKPASQKQLMLASGDTALLGHLVHDAEPTTDLYIPASHAAQLPGLPVNPMGHPATQSIADLLAMGDNEFAGHAEQPAAPAESLYVLAGHAVQLPPLAASPE